MLDILILGSGPAALCLASELAKQDLNIKWLSTISPNEKWGQSCINGCFNIRFS